MSGFAAEKRGRLRRFLWRIGRRVVKPLEVPLSQPLPEPPDEELPDDYYDSGLLKNVHAAERRAGISRGAKWKHRLFGWPIDPAPSFRGPVEDFPAPGEERIGVCCSGGGIRSAAFNLGALQVLQEECVMEKADYLAAVSGGSYIAAAFAMAGKTGSYLYSNDPAVPPQFVQGPEDSDAALIAAMKPFAQGSPEEQYLRNRTTYMAPRFLDKVSVVARIAVGLLINLTLICLPIFGAMSILAFLVLRPAYPGLVECGLSGSTAECSFAIPGWVGWTLIGLGLVFLILGLWLATAKFRSRRKPGALGVARNEAAKAQATQPPAMPAKAAGMENLRGFVEQSWRTSMIVIPCFALVMIALPWMVDQLWSLNDPKGATSAPSGLGLPAATAPVVATSLLASVMALLRGSLASPKRALGDIGKVRTAIAKLKPKTLRAIAMIGASMVVPLVFLLTMGSALSFALQFEAANPEHFIGVPITPVAIGATALVACLLLWYFADLNTWSLHTFYKRRLCSVFALRRVKAPGSPPNGFGDGIAQARPFDQLQRLSNTALKKDEWPTLLVCAAANISDYGATPPGRGVASFTFSPTAIGGPLTGAVSTLSYEGATRLFSRNATRREADITLPAAVAMSGAAISPSMGKQTRKPLRALLALANVRLGVWVPNPRWVPQLEEKFRMRKRPRAHYLLKEMFGWNRVNDRFLYVTDGGHYENLGLVELLRRGCTVIYCFDASGGSPCGQLGDAIALARSELGVEMSIDAAPLPVDPDSGFSESNVLEGTFKYRKVANEEQVTGKIYYARNLLTADAPADVLAHHENDPTFPNDPTSDQLFTDMKFESYRALGELAARNALAAANGGGTPDGVVSADDHYRLTLLQMEMELIGR